uniref:Uncharacterized protein n=1 Tax=Kalanchoe fedtschenkoi TaxID=63787 RepID=A0A7N0ZQV7_KALFE
MWKNVCHVKECADHIKWVGLFHRKHGLIDVFEKIFRGAMRGKLTVANTLPLNGYVSSSCSKETSEV